MSDLTKKITAAAIVVIPSAAWVALCATTWPGPAISFFGGYVVGSLGMLGAIFYWHRA